MKFLKLAFIYKKHDTFRCVTFLYTKSMTLSKNTLSDTALVNPVNPGPFNPPAQGTGSQIEAAKDVWRDTKFTFELCQATENALIAQAVDATNATYLAALRNVDSSRYGDSIRSLTQHLYSIYRRITPQQVKLRELELYNIPFDLLLPVDSIFNAVDDLMELSEHAGIPMTPDQSVNLGYVIFARQPILLALGTKKSGRQDLAQYENSPP